MDLTQVNFFPPNFSFVFWKKKFWREKNLLCKFNPEEGIFSVETWSLISNVSVIHLNL
jgi:hypothetical protein